MGSAVCEWDSETSGCIPSPQVVPSLGVTGSQDPKTSCLHSSAVPAPSPDQLRPQQWKSRSGEVHVVPSLTRLCFVPGWTWSGCW